MIIIALQREEDGSYWVAVAPITHAAPTDPSAAIEIPAVTCRRCGLDDERQWLVVGEVNTFVWPGPDLRPQPGHGIESVVMGVLPPKLTQIVRERLEARWQKGLTEAIARSE